ncbi:twin-arginine translocase TatA/TatE family subunit, partial [Brevibacterium sp.]|uniref:Sec-independent protein translocase subunit TatA/TatB n=1 Tax=Brevibacterium sp. TaxID=1701 RepID=UPI002648EAA2
MLGLSFEKMLIAGLIAVIVIGPRRLPHYAQKLGELIRMFRAQLTTAQTRAAQAVGAEDWESLDPRRYDPRRIVREALHEPAPDP